MTHRAGAAALLFFFMITTVLSSEPTNASGDIRIHISGVAADVGVLRVSLFDSAEGFPSHKEKAVRRYVEKAENETCLVLFQDVPFGTYAVGVLHDQNDNGQLDKNFLGVPTEPIAVSNNVKIRFGPPRFEDAQFELHSPDITLSIDLPGHN